MFKSYGDLFTGLGVLNTGFKYKIPVDGNIHPSPPVVMEPVREELKRMEHNNVIRLL